MQLFSDRPPTREEHHEFLERLSTHGDRIEFVIFLNDGDVPVGAIGLSHIDPGKGEAEYGILIGEASARGQGLAREASELILSHGFRSLGLRRVVLNVFADNAAAIRLYERLGFRIVPEGTTTRMKNGVSRETLRMVMERPAGLRASS
jgi:RimJ/RimL family protein N-acetyltransferase